MSGLGGRADTGVVWVPVVVGEQAGGCGGWVRLLTCVRGDGLSAPQPPERADLQIKKGTKRNCSVCFVFPSGKRKSREYSHGPNMVFNYFCVAFLI